MYKKAGIVISIALVIIAIVIFLIANAVNSSNSEPSDLSDVTTTTTQAATQSTKAPVVQTNVAPTTTAPQVPVVDNTTQAPVTSNTAGNLTVIDSSTLPSYVDSSDIGTVVGRKVYAYNGQVLFALTINTTMNGQLEYFTTLTNYNLTDGTRVEVDVRTYQASTGSFPSIIAVRATKN